MTAAQEVGVNKAGTGQVRSKGRTRGLQLFLLITALVWLLPLLWAIYTSLRPYASTAVHGYVSIAGEYNFDNYTNAWNNAEMGKYFVNTLIITLPAVAFTLFLASMAAFALSRFSFRFNLKDAVIYDAIMRRPYQ